MKRIIFFISGFNDILLENKIIYNWQNLSKFFSYKNKISLWPYVNFIIYKIEDKNKIIKFMLDEKNLISFFIFNNNIYNINFLKNLYKSLKIKANKKFNFINIIYRKHFILNLIKYIFIQKKKNLILKYKK